LSDSEFIWRDGERAIHFRAGAVSDSPDILGGYDFDRYELLTTERAMGAAPVELAEEASNFHHVPPGPVAEVAARVIEDVSEFDLVALGGGRVIDVAKAIVAVRGGRVAALPTTLSGAEMTRIHRLPDGHEADSLVRPGIVLADPPVMTSLPEQPLRATAMNALAHGADSLYTPLANPASEWAALRGARLIGDALDAKPEQRDRAGLALGSILCGYAIDSAGMGLHHLVCQTLVRLCGTPHAETNAAILPQAVELLAGRAPEAYELFAKGLGTDRAHLTSRIEELGRSKRLSEAGGDASKLDEAIEAMLKRPELQRVPRPPDGAELRNLVERAW
jgi:alcohol dehydrogenase class IV